jgi:ribose transport system substrate-binding protein
MIDAKLDAIIVDAGSATALDRVISDACAKGIAVANFDSLVDTNDLTTKIDTDQGQRGKLAAEWLVKQLNGKGNVLVLNGPAGVSVSDDRRKGADPVFKANPGIKILAETALYAHRGSSDRVREAGTWPRAHDGWPERSSW